MIHKNEVLLKNYLQVLLVVFILFSSNANAQQYIWHKGHDVDSLLEVIVKQDGYDRIKTLNHLAYSLYFIDFEVSKQYAEEAMDLSEKLGYKEGIAEAYRNLGYIYWYGGDYPEALKKCHKSMTLYEELNNRYKLARLYEVIAGIHYNCKNIQKAQEYVNTAMNIFKEKATDGGTVGNVMDTLRIHMRLAFLFGETGLDLKKALHGYKAYRDAAKENDAKEVELFINTWYTGYIYHMLGQWDSARICFDEALEYPEKDPSIRALKYQALSNLGWLQYTMGEYDSAIASFTTAVEWYSKTGFLWMAMLRSNRLAGLYLYLGDFIKAEKYYRHSESLFNEMITRDSWCRHDSLRHIISYGTELYQPLPALEIKEKLWTQAVQMFKRMYELSSKKSRLEDALQYHIAYSDAKDTLDKILSHRETMELAIRYESERKDQQIETLSMENEWKESRLKQNRYFFAGLGIIVILVIILAVVLIRQNKLREQQKNILLQQKLFRSQLNPHFLFNSLSSIHNFILHEESAMAGRYLSKFSKLVRSILDCSVEEYISLEKEINTIENYLELQKIRFPDKFSYSIDIDESIDQQNTKIPPMLLQPFIENSIEHGFKHQEGKGSINISFDVKNGMMQVELKDDGIGREKAQEILDQQNRDHKSLATAITRERIQILNKKLKKKIWLDIEDMRYETGEPAGTKVLFELPVK